MTDDEKLENLLEQLVERQMAESDLAENILDQVDETDIEQINDMPLLYRMELKQLLEANNRDLANEIKTE